MSRHSETARALLDQWDLDHFGRKPIADSSFQYRVREDMISRIGAALERLARFKSYVHERLDAMGVPVDPSPEENAKHGCRIEGRLNFIFAERDRLCTEKANMRARLAEIECAECGRSEAEHLVHECGRYAEGNGVR